MEQGQFDHADLEFKNAQNALEQFLPLLPHDLDPARRALVERLLPYALNERGKLLLEEGDIQGAQSVMLESIAGYHAMTLSYPGNNAWFLMMGGSRGALAEVYLLGGDSDKALDAANAMNRDFQSANSPTGDAGDCVIFGRVLNARHELQKAVKVYEGCLAMAQPESEYMADALGYYGDALLASGNPVGALKQFTQELELARRLAGIDATNADAISGVAAALARLAEVPSSGVSWREVVAEYELRKKVGSLTSADQHQLTAALAAIERQ